MYRTSITNVAYDAARGAFQGLVVFEEGSDLLRVPVELKCPMTVDPKLVLRAFAQEARRRRREGRLHLSSHRIAAALPLAA